MRINLNKLIFEKEKRSRTFCHITKLSLYYYLIQLFYYLIILFNYFIIYYLSILLFNMKILLIFPVISFGAFGGGLF